jgi:transposase
MSKSDVRDCQWIAQLLQCGLLKGSFIPPRAQRELRDLTRHCTQLVEEKTRTINRIQKVLEDANIKLASVASDVMGRLRTGHDSTIDRRGDRPPQARRPGAAPIAREDSRAGESPGGEANRSSSLPDEAAVERTGAAEEVIAELEAKIEEHTRPFAAEIDCLDAIPGVDRRVAQVLLAEVGADMKTFPNDQHLSSWAGMCPGNEESAGKRTRRRITPGNRWLKKTLAQAAWAASRTKNTYLASQYRRVAGRRGKKRALIAVGHSMLVIFYHMMRSGASYAGLGGDFFDRLEPERLTRYYVKRLERLGHKVTLETNIAA